MRDRLPLHRPAPSPNIHALSTGNRTVIKNRPGASVPIYITPPAPMRRQPRTCLSVSMTSFT